MRQARWLKEIAPGFLALAILIETSEDYRERDLIDQAARLIEIFGVEGVAQIVGCAWHLARRYRHVGLTLKVRDAGGEKSA